ncbi:MAG: Holliday junction resolvase RuvX [Sphingomonadales bacterium]|nr:Holliday junction resolvase RuvX [Sphingomonadales bacterium]
MALTTSVAEFAAALPPGGKLAGLDVGTKTIGLALCDAQWSFAGPVETVARTKFTADLAALKAFTTKHAVIGLVVGLPLNLDGSDSPRTQSVRAFGRNLAHLNLPMLLWDERRTRVSRASHAPPLDRQPERCADRADPR